MSAATVSVKLSPRFYDDHVYRDCNGGREIRRTRTYVIAELDREAYEDLRSDALYYATLENGDPYLSGLISSARAALKRLDALALPWAEAVR